MMRALFSGVSGLRNHQMRLDVIGNNIANVNTIGYKSSRVNFQELFSQTIQGASAPTEDRGGTNPQQIGLGMKVGSIDTLHNQGNLQVTGKSTDLAIQGDGFFVLKRGERSAYTRAGTFDRDASGYLVNPTNGLRVQGWTATNGVLPARDSESMSDIIIPVGQTINASATTSVTYGNNLDASTAIGDSFTAPVDVYDSLGNAHTISFEFTKTAVAPPAHTWDWEVTDPGGNPIGDGTVEFDTTGAFSAQTVNTAINWTPSGADPIAITPDLSHLSQFASETTIQAIDRDGYPMGTLENFTIDSKGVVTGSYSNGLTQTLAQVALAAFSNPGGLFRAGENLYMESNNSGLPQIGEANSGGRGGIAPGNLEMSNVDLAQEFTNMVVTQRGFQGNSRVITSADKMLEELVNLKR
jgi:flagellar hook protein FlgE